MNDELLQRVKDEYANSKGFKNFVTMLSAGGKEWTNKRVEEVIHRYAEAYHAAKIKEVEEKEYQIDFEGYVLAGIKVKGSELELIGAMNGYGNKIENILIIRS